MDNTIDDEFMGLADYDLFLETVIKPIQEEVLKGFEKVLFLKDNESINLGVEQNQLLPTIQQDVVGKIEGI
jgi:hypothetical protein